MVAEHAGDGEAAATGPAEALGPVRAERRRALRVVVVPERQEQVRAVARLELAHALAEAPLELAADAEVADRDDPVFARRLCPAGSRQEHRQADEQDSGEAHLGRCSSPPSPTWATTRLPSRRDPLEQACELKHSEPATEVIRSHVCRLSFPQGLRRTSSERAGNRTIPRTDASRRLAQALGGERLSITPCVGSCSNDEVKSRVSVRRLIVSASPGVRSPSANGGFSGSAR